MTLSPMKIHLIAGTRPNIVKIAPLYRYLKAQAWCVPQFLWVTQHYTPELARDILEDFDVYPPDATIEIPDAQYGTRLGAIIERYSTFCETMRPDLVLVAGDVDTSIGISMAARRLNLPLAHLEAGLRSHDPSMPEEINRILIDAISNIWLAPSETAQQNLILHEGKPPEQVHFVGNIMIDSLRLMLDRDQQNTLLQDHGLQAGAFGVATFHRPANVDDLEDARWVIDTLEKISTDDRMVFPIHPRTRSKLDKHGLLQRLERIKGVLLLPPLRYRHFINLLAVSKFILTDSGGIQEEAAYLQKPCFTLRTTTERPITIYCGSNHLVDHESAYPIIRAVMDQKFRDHAIDRISLWDGFTSHRVAHVLWRWWHEQ